MARGTGVSRGDSHRRSSTTPAPEAPSGDRNWLWGGYVGGEYCPETGEGANPEAPPGFGRFGEPADWDGDERDLCHEARLVTGDEYDYLGHFAQQRYLKEGHNTIWDMLNPKPQPPGGQPSPVQPGNAFPYERGESPIPRKTGIDE